MRRILTAAVLAAATALTAGCAQTPPPVSDKVQKYYDENVANAKATLPPERVIQKAAFLGDSYTFGSGATSMQLRWSSIVARSLSWGEVNVGVGGTGYSNAGTKSGGTTYIDRVAKVVASKPAIVVVSGGRNDLVQKDFQIVEDSVSKTFADLRAGLPKAKIIALSPVWDASTPPVELAAVAEDVRTAVEAVGGTYVDIGQPLKSHPNLLIDDAVHPNDAGHKALADATVTAILKTGVAKP